MYLRVLIAFKNIWIERILVSKLRSYIKMYQNEAKTYFCLVSKFESVLSCIKMWGSCVKIEC